MTQMTIGEIIAAQAQGLAGAAEHGAQGAAGHGADGTAGVGGTPEVGAASDAGALFLDTPLDLHVTINGATGGTNLVIGSIDGQTLLALDGGLLIEVADGQDAQDPGEHIDHASLAAPRPGFPDLHAPQHDMPALDLGDRLMAKFHEHGDWSWMG
ncbi:hypothetical protein E2C06_12840 [Dankookia rubra]|uniref:Uncharacterized protein n=1 Tax=Dankookia rubra TaxID=1442381 RepID=A0A4R5QG52_9PROT|nr:hypothetical protein [Dankookia rubra]TDH62264.1 hypothetical protein E2C06_12840 [Dankookia rubra]